MIIITISYFAETNDASGAPLGGRAFGADFSNRAQRVCTGPALPSPPSACAYHKCKEVKKWPCDKNAFGETCISFSASQRISPGIHRAKALKITEATPLFPFPLNLFSQENSIFFAPFYAPPQPENIITVLSRFERCGCFTFFWKTETEDVKMGWKSQQGMKEFVWVSIMLLIFF